jgi:hypothetical protein
VTHTYLLHGRVVEVPDELAARRSDAKANVIVNSSSSVPISEREPIIAGDSRFHLAGNDGAWTLTWPGLLSAEMVEQSDGSVSLRFGQSPEVAPGFESLLLSAAVGAFSMLQGSFVLHGTAVERNGHAAILLAPPGGGKSSLAALTCSAGARVIAEDICALTVNGTRVWVHSGIHELRLRDTTPGLVELPGTQLAYTHPDGRTAVRPQACALDPVPVTRIVLLSLDRTIDDVLVRPVSRPNAVASLIKSQRCEPNPQHKLAAQMFDQAITCANAVDVVTASIPWALSRRVTALGLELLDAILP